MADRDEKLSDAKLVQRALAGDRAAFGVLVERHRVSVARLLQATFGNLAGVEDLVQESFLRAYLDLERLQNRAQFAAWVRGIAANLARMELRSWQTAIVYRESMQTQAGAPQIPTERLIERREVARRIRKAIAALPPAEREAIVQVYLNELSHR